MNYNALSEITGYSKMNIFFKNNHPNNGCAEYAILSNELNAKSLYVRNYSTDAGENFRVYVIPEPQLNNLLSKLGENILLIIGNKLLYKILQKPHSISSKICRVLIANNKTSVFLFNLIKFGLSFQQKIDNQPKSVSYNQVTEAEMLIMEIIHNWEILSQVDKAAKIKADAMLDIQSYYIGLTYLLYFRADWEDLCGMLNNKKSETIALIIQNTAIQMTRAILIREGYFHVENNSKYIEYLNQANIRPHLKRCLRSINSLFSPVELDKISLYDSSCVVFAEAINSLADNLIARVGLYKYDGNVEIDISPPKTSVSLPLSPKKVDDIYIENALAFFDESINSLLQRIHQSFSIRNVDHCIKLTGSLGLGLTHERSDIDIIVLLEQLPTITQDSINVIPGHKEVCITSAKKICVAFFSIHALEEVSQWISSMTDQFNYTGTQKDSLIDVKLTYIHLFRQELFSVAVDAIVGFPLEGIDKWSVEINQEDLALATAIYYLIRLEKSIDQFKHTTYDPIQNELILNVTLRDITTFLLRVALSSDGILFKNDKWVFELAYKNPDKYLQHLNFSRRFLTISLRNFNKKTFISMLNDLIINTIRGKPVFLKACKALNIFQDLLNNEVLSTMTPS